MPHEDISKCTVDILLLSTLFYDSLIIKLLHLRNRIDSLYPVTYPVTPNVLRAIEGTYFSFYTKCAFVHCFNFIESVITTRRRVQEGSTVVLNI